VSARRSVLAGAECGQASRHCSWDRTAAESGLPAWADLEPSLSVCRRGERAPTVLQQVAQRHRWLGFSSLAAPEASAPCAGGMRRDPGNLIGLELVTLGRKPPLLTGSIDTGEAGRSTCHGTNRHHHGALTPCPRPAAVNLGTTGGGVQPRSGALEARRMLPWQACLLHEPSACLDVWPSNASPSGRHQKGSQRGPAPDGPRGHLSPAQAWLSIREPRGITARIPAPTCWRDAGGEPHLDTSGTVAPEQCQRGCRCGNSAGTTLPCMRGCHGPWAGH